MIKHVWKIKDGHWSREQYNRQIPIFQSSELPILIPILILEKNSNCEINIEH